MSVQHQIRCDGVLTELSRGCDKVTYQKPGTWVPVDEEWIMIALLNPTTVSIVRGDRADFNREANRRHFCSINCLVGWAASAIDGGGLARLINRADYE